MAFQKLGALIERPASTVSSGGNLALANNSAGFQRITGTSAHTVTLPQANAASPNECPNGLKFVINNRSTDVVTVNYFGGALAATLAAGTQRTFRLSDNSTSAGDWDITNESGGGSGEALSEDEKLGVLAALASGLYKDAETDATTIKVNPEEIGGNFWLLMAPMPTARQSLATFDIDGYGYGAAGYNGSYLVVTERFDGTNNYWLSRANMIGAREEMPGSFTLNGRGYVFGGHNGVNPLATAEQYNPELNSWASRTSLGTARYRMYSGAVLGYGYAMSGANPSTTVLNVVERYDDVANAWYQIASGTAAGRAGHGRFILNDKIYLAGGYQNGGGSSTSISSSEVFEPSLSTFKLLPATISARSYMAAGSASSVGFLAGGQTGSSVNVVERFIEHSTSFVTSASLSANKAFARDISVDGQSSIIGGGGPSAVNERFVTHSFFQVPLSKKSTAVPTSIFAAAALNGVATSVPVRLRTDGDSWKYFEANKDGLLKHGETLAGKFNPQPLPYYTGGNDGSSAQSVNRFYNANSDAWVSRQSQASARYQQSGFSLDGNGYVLAGYDGASAVNENKYYGEIVNAFTTRTNPNAAHRDCAGSSLNGYGYIYVTGTVGITADTTQRFLQYNSATNSFSSKTVLTTDVYSAPMLSAGGRVWVQGGQNTSGTEQQLNQEYIDATNSWTNRANIGFVRKHHGGFVLNDKSYVLGGEQGGSPTNAIETYNIGTNSWTHSGSGTGDLPVSMSFGRGFVGDGYGYLIGGFTGSFTARFYQFNPFTLAWTGKTTDGVRAQVANGYAPAPYKNYQLQVGLPTYLAAVGAGQWVAKANMNSAKAPLSYFTIGEISYQSYGNIAAGSGRTNDLQGYYTTINTWITETSGALSAADTGGQCVTNTLGARGFINGHNDAGSLDGGTQVYDNVLRAWTVLATGGGSGQGNSNFVINGFAYSAGGGPGVPAHTTATYRYTPATNSWSSNIATTSIAHYGGVGGVYDGFVFLAGSSTGSSNVNERFNDAANVWNTRTSLPTHTEATGSVVLGNGWHIVAGYNGGPSNTHQVYRAETDSWSNSTVYPISAHQVGGGKVGNDGYFAGGYTGSYTTASYQWASAIQNIVLGAALRVGE